MKSFIMLTMIFFTKALYASNCGNLRWKNIAIEKSLSEIAFTSENGSVVIWDVASGSARKLPTPKISIKELFYVNDSKLIAVGIKEGRGPYFYVWNLKNGTGRSLDNTIFRDMAGDIISNLSQNNRYVVSSGQLFYGGWGYHVLDLQTGKTVLSLKGKKGQAQISHNLDQLYIASQKGDHQSAYMEIYDIPKKEVVYEDYLSSTYSRDDRMSWSGTKIVFSGYNALFFDSKTRNVENLFARGSLKSYSKDLSIMAHSSSFYGKSYTIRSKNPLYVRDLRPNEKTITSKLSQDGKRMLAVTDSNKAIIFDVNNESYDVISECFLTL